MNPHGLFEEYLLPLQTPALPNVRGMACRFFISPNDGRPACIKMYEVCSASYKGLAAWPLILSKILNHSLVGGFKFQPI